jgi:hypothetical protein
MIVTPTWSGQMPMTKLEAILFFNDLITILAWTSRVSGLIRQMATSVIRMLLKHSHGGFNNNSCPG